MTAFIAGFFLSFSLILAIGAQNAFVLRQGLRRSHVFTVCLTCAVSDAILIAAGVAGMGWIASSVPWLPPLLKWGGAAFLIVYGALALRSALRGGGALDPSMQGAERLWPVLVTCLALNWLNPHVYLDTLVLIGSVSAAYPGAALAFGTGAGDGQFRLFLRSRIRGCCPAPTVRASRRLAGTGRGCRADNVGHRGKPDHVALGPLVAPMQS